MPSSEVKARIAQTVQLDEWANEYLPKAGGPRWTAVLHFFSIDCVKAGFLTKQRGVWSLTAEGEEALKLGADGFLDTAMKRYREWREKNPSQRAPKEPAADEESLADLTGDSGFDSVKLEEIEQTARDSLRRHIDAKNAYEFQDMVGALLRGMGYFTPFIAPRGKDGGVDLIAYKDPLGTIAPRIKVQVKHREQSATVQELRELTGILRRGDDVGIFVSTGGFSPDCQREARQSDRHSAPSLACAATTNKPDGAPQYPAGSVVAGYPLSGFRGRMLTTGGMGFLACDVVNVLKNNAFPFEWD